jgi:hypothetical protein
MAMVTAVFLLSAAMVLQNSIISRLHMLQGSADLVLLVLGYLQQFRSGFLLSVILVLH